MLILYFYLGGMHLIRKERVLPPRIEKEEALLRRLPKNHKKWKEILRNLKKVSTGFKGEHELDYHLEFLPDEDFDILCDLRIPLDHRTFQMDTLVLSPHFALIIESKNIFGTLLFDDTSKQLFRTFEGKREGFANPIQQAKRQQILFERWLKRHLLKTIPVYHLVSIGLPSTIIETTAKNAELFNKVLHAEHTSIFS
jgi:hypothetical protein